jgi:hypothetical protein
LTYVYVRKNLSHIEDPQEQTLLKAFLKALYNDNYVADCEDSFGFVRVSGELKDRALAAIDTLVLTDATAQEWFFEESTEATVGAADYVISQKRKAYSELEQDQVVGLVASLQNQITVLMSENSELFTAVDYLEEEVVTLSASMVSIQAASDSAANSGFFEDNTGYGSFGEDEETALKAALALSIISFTLWMLALVFIFAKFVFNCF